MRVVVLGGGLVGRPMALDLARDEGTEVTVADTSAQALERVRASHPGIVTVRRDLSDAAVIRDLVAGRDYVVNALPGHLGFAALRAIIEAGTDVVDIAFYAEDPFELDRAAKERGVVAVVDCGVAPGMSNLLVGHAHRILDRTETVLILVGGLPAARIGPYEYKAPFSPIDVIAEYTRPARFVENGELVVRPALSDPEPVEFPGVGTLEAFNTDGLRTLAVTLDAPNMKEKTLRYPGHIEKIALLSETGFFGEEEVEVGGVRVRPVDLAAKLLFPMWQLEEGEPDLTVMRVHVAGTKDGRPASYTWELFDRHDEESGIHSMARTTGYTATVVLRLLASGLYREAGISPPEFLGRDPACVEFVLRGLADRGVVYQERVL